MRGFLPLLVAISLITAETAQARQVSSAGDAAAKAAIIYNFTRFSSWSDSRFATPASAVVLCVRPQHPLAAHLAAFDGRPVGDRNLQVRRTATFDASCHAAVVDSADLNPTTLTSLARRGVLTIGDTRGFISHGAIGLVTIGRQVRFEINNRIAREAGVVLSSRLLRLAVLVR
ncbi:YfiR family protein [Brevundimonas sp.]|uniref:YfiR family protein n=1 Tax=Brevundimonas sp. TaxID=1871086 RepID=UPI002D352ADD|nr:YfiR family protein [Brevundimonas sp.]HYC73941.1 YfiR family protein [Brevundimonas sp.]